jgi:subtilase family serine protease
VPRNKAGLRAPGEGSMRNTIRRDDARAGHGKRRAILTIGAGIALTTGIWAGSASAHPSTTGSTAQSHKVVSNCGAPAHKGWASCFSRHRTGIAQPRSAAAAPDGYGPSDLQSAYNISPASSAETVAIVDAYDDPNAEADLAKYRSQYGLPACTTANGCFKKVDQSGGSDYPTADSGWAGEISLDLDMVSAISPNSHILLVEADDPSFDNLGAAEDTAAANATIVSNSWGGGDASDSTYGKYFKHSGVAVMASAGDDGYQGASYPASSSSVIAVGGTSLNRDSSSRGWSETVWDGTGSGCSSLNAAISGSSDADTGCSGRAMNDVSAVADPNTGVAVYDSYQSGGWNVYGGTSASSPIIAGVIANAGNSADVTPSTPYAHADALNDVTSGDNGSCSPTQLCTARAGWDGPTGLGTPNGTGAF